MRRECEMARAQWGKMTRAHCDQSGRSLGRACETQHSAQDANIGSSVGSSACETQRSFASREELDPTYDRSNNLQIFFAASAQPYLTPPGFVTGPVKRSKRLRRSASCSTPLRNSTYRLSRR